MSHVTCNLSSTPTATATDPTLHDRLVNQDRTQKIQHTGDTESLNNADNGTNTIFFGSKKKIETGPEKIFWTCPFF